MNTTPITPEEMDKILEKKKKSLRLIRAFDAVASLGGIIVLSPLLLLTGIAVKVSSKGPVLYSQERVGRNQKLFRIHKFRTMVQGADKMGTLVTVSNDKRITKVGRILRRTKLDELPQLFNVLFGDMALVGPRPEVKRYVDHYDENALQLLRLRPGVTDLASIEYSQESDLLDSSEDVEKTYIEEIMPEKHALNYTYIREMSLLNNIKVMLKTLGKLLK
jgi:lipopolysaccharide/colanic/teichoic acid biosynthesis glycosyltransferase